MLFQNGPSEQYGFSAQPKTVKPRTKFREPSRPSDEEAGQKG